MGLSNRRPRRHTGHSAEPQKRHPRRRRSADPGACFVIRQHAQREGDYHFGLEIDGVLVSWAIPRGPVVTPQDRLLARRTEDRPLGEGGVGVGALEEDVIVWDSGTYANKTGHEMATCLHRGHLSIVLDGEKVHGSYGLTRVRDGAAETWLLVKRYDGVAAAVSRAKPER